MKGEARNTLMPSGLQTHLQFVQAKKAQKRTKALIHSVFKQRRAQATFVYNLSNPFTNCPGTKHNPLTYINLMAFTICPGNLQSVQAAYNLSRREGVNCQIHNTLHFHPSPL